MPACKILMIFLFLIISLISISYVVSQASISLSIKIEPEYLIMSAGDRMLIQINLIQLGDQRRKDVTVSLSLVDSEGKTIDKSTETIALETQASLVSILDIPKDANAGIYDINVDVSDTNKENLLGKASKEIIIEKTKITRENIYLIGICLGVIALFILLVILYKQNRNLHKGRAKLI